MKPAVYKVLYPQWISACCLFVFVWISQEHRAAYSVLCGALVSVIPTICFALLFFQPYGVKAVARLFYMAEGMKWAMTVLFFMGMIFYLKLIWWLVFLGFGWTQLSLVFCQREK